MHKVSIHPQWTISDAQGSNLPLRLLDLLAEVDRQGSLHAACKTSGASYRYAWSLIEQGEKQLQQALLERERGKGSKLTALGQKLVWAGRRVQARLSPMLETLASELELELQKALHPESAALRIHASHGFAVEKLIETLSQIKCPVDRKYMGSVEAVASLHSGACDLAGFHTPLGEFEAKAYAHYAKWFHPERHRIIHVTTRTQGLMVAKGNPLGIGSVEDLRQPGLRFVNRQPGSGTRFLLECLLDKAGIRASELQGMEQGEFTHAAIAAYVASGMADVGLGVETPARRFDLDFVPVVKERYFLLCEEKSIESGMLGPMLDVLGSREFQSAVNRLPGYSATNCGRIETLGEAFSAVKIKKANR
jgi:molybdate transport repressor ModE-like protein